MDIKLVVFDWSGTVSDDTKPVYETYTRLAKKFNLKVISFGEWRDAVAVTLDEFFRNQGLKGEMNRLWETYEETFDIVSQDMVPTVYPEAEKVF